MIRPLTNLLVFAFLTICGCQQGSVGHEAISRCVPEGACDEAMFRAGLGGEPPDLARGADLFRSTCGSCHGADGGGRTAAAAPGLPPIRADFRDPVWQAGLSDRDIADAVLRGRPPSMPAMPLNDVQLRDVVAYVRSLNTSASAPYTAPPYSP